MSGKKAPACVCRKDVSTCKPETNRGFPKLGVPFWGSPEQGLSYLGVYIGVFLFRETTKCSATLLLVVIRRRARETQKNGPRLNPAAQQKQTTEYQTISCTSTIWDYRQETSHYARNPPSPPTPPFSTASIRNANSQTQSPLYSKAPFCNLLKHTPTPNSEHRTLYPNPTEPCTLNPDH